MIDLFNSETGFFEDSGLYVIYECGTDRQDYSTYSLEQDEYGSLIFSNLYTDITHNGNVHKDIALNPGDMSITERIDDNKAKVCYENYYKLNGGALSLNEKDLTFNITPDEKNPSQEFVSIRIHKV